MGKTIEEQVTAFVATNPGLRHSTAGVPTWSMKLTDLLEERDRIAREEAYKAGSQEQVRRKKAHGEAMAKKAREEERKRIVKAYEAYCDHDIDLDDFHQALIRDK